jgi:tetratricopeptide (TPR) repeat protein
MATSRQKGCALALLGGCLVALLFAGAVFVLVTTLVRTTHRRVEIAHDWIELAPTVERVSAEEQEEYARALESGGLAGMDALTDLIEAHPDCYNLYYDRAAMARAMGDLDSALGDYLFATPMQLDGHGTYFPLDDSDAPPPAFVAMLDLAEVFRELGDVEAALETARSSLLRDPEHPYRPLIYIGSHQCDLERYEEALQNFERALECEDRWLFSEVRVEALAGEARALHGLGRDEEALEAYALARMSDWRAIDAELHFDMALVMLDRGDAAGAERSLRHALDVDPGNSLVRQALERVESVLDEELQPTRRTRDF